MASKELVPVHSKELARTDESPCPVWDHQVRTTVLEIDRLARNHDIFPDDRRIEREHLDYALRKLVDEVESGKWTETLPEPPVEVEPDTVQFGVKSILELTEDEFAERWDMMTRGDKLAWILDVTDK